MLARALVLPALVLLIGCPQPSDKGPQVDDTAEEETGVPEDDDADDDGFGVEEDCDDDNPFIYPGAADDECDGLDNDCDDEIDEDVALSAYADEDGDGFGDPTRAMSGCDAPDTYVSDGTDCDDGQATVYPGADEVCDEQDNDCDGEADEDATDALVWYADGDQDGFGLDDATTSSCTQPDGYAMYGGDCDDVDPAFNPGAEELDCEDPNDYNCDGSTGYADADADGFAACKECDDADPAHFPGADETCDGVDDDCDGEIDEDSAIDAATWYGDADGDGFGVPDLSALACDQPDGFADNADDCDDLVSTTFPGADETCNLIDDDCDGEADEDATDALAWYEDLDDDGFGNPLVEQAACEAPDGYVSDDTDCSDDDPDAYPGADETCNTFDDDCDGEVDEDSAIDADTWYPDVDGDGYGSDAETVVACEGPAGWTLDSADCDDDDADVSPSADELCNGQDDDCDSETDEDSAVDAGTWYADADADGYGDPDEETRACELPEGYLDDASDCDDDDDSTYPGADETCDGADDDCDGVVDEDSAIDADTWYADADGDGFGDPAETTLACAAPTGYLADATDCDDDEPTTSPDALEYCDDVDNDCDGETDEGSAVDASTWFRDKDRDLYGNDAKTQLACDRPGGYRSLGGDCNEDDATINPGATETCDGVDEDCDDVVDEDASDASVWYADADDDGYGDPASTLASCELPSGYLDDDSDCDDTQRSVFPGADETCDDQDEDCDGVVDEDPTDAPTWYADADDDGYGDPSATREACDAPSGYVGDDEDCDDDDAGVHPGATETCDGADEDCDGRVDDDAIGLETWYYDGDDDGYGEDDRTRESCDAPTGYAAQGGDCDDDDDGLNPGETEVCEDGLDNDCDGGSNDCALSGDGSVGDATATLLGEEASDKAGYSVAFVGDVDGDGADDLLIGAPGNDRRASSAGSSYLVLGAPTGSVDLSDADAILIGEASSDASGEAVGGGGDVDGDGYDDLLVGAKGNDAGASSAGAAWLVKGPVSGSLSLTLADTCLVGEDASDYAGSNLDLVGDLDGDGLAEIGVGARNHTVGGVKGGAVYIVSTPSSGDIDLSTSDAMIYGETAYDYASTPGSAGDVDGDGLDDLLVGAEGEDDEGSGCGAAFLFLGPVSGSRSTSDADGARFGEEFGDAAGASLDGAGDVNGDGYADTVVGAYKADYSAVRDAGGTYLLLGSWSGTGLLADADAIRYGTTRSDSAGISVSGAGDTDGDGHADLLIGAVYNDEAGSDAGAAWLVLGPVSGTASLTAGAASWAGESTTDYAGYAVSGGGDANADGKADLLIGAYNNDDGASNAGASYLVLGAGL